MRHKLVVYTAIIGGDYDDLLQPEIVEENVDYICYVKKGSQNQRRIGAWEIREIDYENADNTRVARYAKMHPHLLFPNHKYSLWIDGNIQIVDKEVYAIIDGKIENGVLISSLAHPHVTCCYDDAMICIAAKKDKAWRILLQMCYLKLLGFPKNYGMYETNVFYRNHQSIAVVNFNNQWWNLLSHFSRRDQLGCTFSMWKNKIPMDYLLPMEMNARNSTIFKYYHHKVRLISKQPSILKKYLYGIIKRITRYRS